jgi:methylmalonyl-CoA epimerase
VITGISFVGILVRDIEQALRVYSRLLGLEPRSEGVVEMPGVKAVLLDAGNCSIELLQPTVGPEDPVAGDLARRLERFGEGVCRLGVWVDGLVWEVERLRSEGTPVLDPGSYGGIAEEMGARIAFVHPKAAHGVLIELDERR